MAKTVSRAMASNSASGGEKRGSTFVDARGGGPFTRVLKPPYPKITIRAHCHHLGFFSIPPSNRGGPRRVSPQCPVRRRPKPDVGNPLRQRAHAPLPASRLDIRACHPATNVTEVSQEGFPRPAHPLGRAGRVCRISAGEVQQNRGACARRWCWPRRSLPP